MSRGYRCDPQRGPSLSHSTLPLLPPASLPNSANRCPTLLVVHPSPLCIRPLIGGGTACLDAHVTEWNADARDSGLHQHHGGERARPAPALAPVPDALAPEHRRFQG